MDTASKTPNSCHYSKGKTTSFSLLLLPTPNGMGRRRIHAALILYKTLGYPELGSSFGQTTNCSMKLPKAEMCKLACIIVHTLFFTK